MKELGEGKPRRQSKRLPLLLALFCFFCVLLLTPAASALQTLRAGMKGPDFSLKSVTGETKTFADVKGDKLTVLVFWTTWDANSERALARMQKLHGKYRDRGLVITGVNANGQTISAQDVREIKAFRDRLQITFPLFVDQGLVTFGDYGVIALPTTVIMDKERMIIYELPGYPLEGSVEMEDFVVAAIEGKNQPVLAVKGGYQANGTALRFYRMGENILKSKQPVETAETWFRKAVEADPAFVLPHLSLGRMYLQRGDMARAQGEFREALASEPGNPIALCESGVILVDEGRGREGTALLAAARRAAEPYPPCYYYAGYAYGTEGRLEDALKMFDEAEKLNPLDYHIFVYKGKVFERQNDWENAANAYKKGLEIILQGN
jgi:tetratricopeptide (TPR) repeat protein